MGSEIKSWQIVSDYYECSVCGLYHRSTWPGMAPCRVDPDRLTRDQIPKGATIYTLEQQQEDELEFNADMQKFMKDTGIFKRR